MNRRSLTNEEKTWADNLRKIWLRRKGALGLTQEKAAELAGWKSQSTVGQYINGNIPLNTDAKIVFAKMLQCSITDIDPAAGAYGEWGAWGGSEVREGQLHESHYNVSQGPEIKRDRVPLISHVQAGQWTDIVDNFAPGDAEDWIPTTATLGPHSFALRVQGDSMTAPSGKSIPEGAIVMVDPDISPENGSIVVAKLTDSDHATLKKLVIDGPNRYLKPLNPDYSVIPINGNCHIVGVAKKVEFDI